MYGSWNFSLCACLAEKSPCWMYIIYDKDHTGGLHSNSFALCQMVVLKESWCILGLFCKKQRCVTFKVFVVSRKKVKIFIGGQHFIENCLLAELKTFFSLIQQLCLTVSSLPSSFIGYYSSFPHYISYLSHKKEKKVSGRNNTVFFSIWMRLLTLDIFVPGSWQWQPFWWTQEGDIWWGNYFWRCGWRW